MKTDNTTSSEKVMTVETTVGDLICAIADAAEEARVTESELQGLIQAVLSNMLKRVH